MTKANRLIINDIEEDYVAVAQGIISELLRLTNHSTTVEAYRADAITLHNLIGVNTANVVVFSPPYGPIQQSKLPRGLGRGYKMTTTAGNIGMMTNSHYRAALMQVIASAYMMLMLHGRCVVVVKDRMATRSKLGKPLQELVAEIMRTVGFDNIRTYTFALQHPSGYVKILRRRGHPIEHLLYEYVVVGEKKPYKR
ncbi:hypothetical protein HRbin01_00606 [archaeon HR01]|nr:hypothetical protein HRbin01_00606 [archaeon HR01]